MFKYLSILFIGISVVWSDSNFFEVSLSHDLMRTKNVYEDSFYETETDILFFFNLSLGKEIELFNKFIVEPSVGTSLGASYSGGVIDYTALNISLPLMYNEKKFKIGPFIKYTYISNLQSQQVSFKDIEMFSLGGKIMTKGSTQLFFDYEYLINNKYSTDDKKFGKVNLYLGNSRIGIGIRKKF